MQNQLFVGNLNFNTTEEQLREAFSPYGNVANVKLPIDRTTQRKRGFGFVTFETEEEARAALSLHDSLLGGRNIRVNLAEQREGGGGREGGNGGHGGGGHGGGGHGGGSRGGRTGGGSAGGGGGRYR